MFVTSRQGAVHVISGDLPLTADQLRSFEPAAESCLSTCPPRVVLNMEGVPLLDSSGLERLLDLRDRCLQRGGVLRLAAPNRLCRDILSITGLDEQIEIFPTVVGATGSFSQ
jgi:anti-anti-sigma factor